jgi:GDP-L-fucose synthase
MYAGDLADAIMKSLNEYDQISDLMNIGLGYDYSINDYYQIAAEVIGWNGEFVYDTTKPVGMKQKLVDITRQSKWGWKPSTSLTSGIQKAYDFYLEAERL